MDYSDYRAAARESLRNNWLTAALVTLVAGLLGAADAGIGIDFDMETVENLDALGVAPGLTAFIQANANVIATALIALGLLYFIIGGAVNQGYNRYILNVYDYGHGEFSDLFSQFENFLNAFVLHFLTGLYVFLWSLLLVIPGIVAGYSYSMVPFLMLDHPEWTPSDCLEQSKNLMYGHKAELFTLELTFIGWALLSALTLGIGNLFLEPYIHTSRAAFYRDLVGAPQTVDAGTGE